MKKNRVIDIITLLFMVLFFYTGLTKLFSIGKFIHLLHPYPVIGRLAPFFAWAIPLFEIFIVALLYFRRTTGLWVSMFSMAALTLYVGLMILFVPGLPCSCGGFIETLSWPQHLVFNASLTCLALIGVLSSRHLNQDKPLMSTNNNAISS
ncbi:MAG: hypothetical protein J0H74_18555 [Chitinophagaceae bacterium]|nr:hypothetical protein [Chitinophagaceae bacterium]